MTGQLFFYVNGKEIRERHAEPEWNLLWYLRNKLRLTGSKLGCGQGGCGACTVLVSRCIDRNSGEIEHRTINACLAPLCSVDGCHVITVEGLGSTNKSDLHVTQTRFAQLYASQCGFCTPGMIMSLYGILTANDNELPTMQDIEEGLDGNLCRCTGYRPILDAAKTFACDIDQIHHDKASLPNTSTTFDKCSSYLNENTVPINQVTFPDKLREYTPESLHIEGSSLEWYRPISLNELIDLRHLYPGDQSQIICGNTRAEFERKYGPIKATRLISITHIQELQELSRADNSLYIGAGVTFARLKAQLTQWTKESPDGVYQALLDELKHFASTQIRNVATVGGNIIAAAPNSDINPVLLAADAQLELHCAEGNRVRKLPLCDFFLGQRRSSIAENEVLVGIRVSWNNTSNKSFFRGYKQARRRDDSRAIVSAAFKVELEQADSATNQWKIVEIRFALGGVAAKTILANHTQQELAGQCWTRETIHKACNLLLEEIPLTESSPGGQYKYKRTLVQSFLFKFYSYVCKELHQSSIESIHENYHRGISHAQQTIPEPPKTQKVIGSSVLHQSAYFHATGEAIYVDDMISQVNTLYGALVLSKHANARIKNIDIGKATTIDGFVSFVNNLDVPGTNKLQIVIPDEEIFVTSIAPCVGAILGIVVAESEHAAKLAASLVQIDYEILSPSIFSIDDAIMHESYFGSEICTQNGDIDKAFADAEHVLEDTIYIGGQEHFYMEPNACIVIPSNDDKEVNVYIGAQNPTAVQQALSVVLDRDISRIICRVKRIGGGFGGKETRGLPPCLAAAVAAVKYSRPVRLALERHEDMSITGHRHPYKIKYRIAFNNEGQFSGLDVQMWNNGGCTLDASEFVLRLGMLHMGNTYQFKNVRLRGRVCKTHLPSNTAFRGFGGPQAMLACETIVEHVAAYLKCDPFSIRCLNLFKEGEMTHFGQALENWNIPRILDELKESSDFLRRRKDVEVFNTNNVYRKRGICMIPVKFGIGIPILYLNQAGALVHVYTDGSVVVSHGGIELGQGLHTKMIAIAAEALDCDINKIRISDTSTDRTNNVTTTGGSVSADINGMAVKHACQQIRERLDALCADKDNKPSWDKLVQHAYEARVDLCARGFYATPDLLDIDFASNKASYNYYTQGAAVTEVEIDALTGDWHLLRVDILMDVGMSLNPGIDIGQIEGGFMQGIGLYTMEELIWGDEKQTKWVKPGHLFSCGPDTYKIPSFNDVPIDFRVSLLSNSKNPRAVYSSKGIGEPPVLLGTSAFFALKQACQAYREQQGLFDYFILHSPATVEHLRMVCVDEFTRRVCADGHVSVPPTGSF